MLPRRPERDVRLMIRPGRFSSRNHRTAAREQAKVPVRHTAITASQSAALVLKLMRSRRMPALLTRMSIASKSARQRSISASAPLKVEMSVPSASAMPPASRITFTVCAALSAWMSLTSTCAPAAAIALAIAAPMPCPAPVTTATLSCNGCGFTGAMFPVRRFSIASGIAQRQAKQPCAVTCGTDAVAGGACRLTAGARA